MVISADAINHHDGSAKKSVDVSDLMRTVKTPSDCANLSLKLVQEGNPKEGDTEGSIRRGRGVLFRNTDGNRSPRWPLRGRNHKRADK